MAARDLALASIATFFALLLMIALAQPQLFIFEPAGLQGAAEPFFLDGIVSIPTGRLDSRPRPSGQLASCWQRAVTRATSVWHSLFPGNVRTLVFGCSDADVLRPNTRWNHESSLKRKREKGQLSPRSTQCTPFYSAHFSFFVKTSPKCF